MENIDFLNNLNSHFLSFYEHQIKIYLHNMNYSCVN